MGFIRGCCGSRRALSPQPCLGEHSPVLAWGCFCWDGAGAPWRVCPGPPWLLLPSACASSIPGPGQRVPARGVPADHPPPGLDGRAGQGPPGLTRICRVFGGDCGTPGNQKDMCWQTPAPDGNPSGMWAVDTWQGWPVMGNSNPSLGDKAET